MKAFKKYDLRNMICKSHCKSHLIILKSAYENITFYEF